MQGKCDVAREIVWLTWTNDGMYFFQIAILGQQNSHAELIKK